MKTLDTTGYVTDDYKILKKQNGPYIFKHTMKNKETGETKVIHNFSCSDVESFLEHIHGKVTDVSYEYVKEQKTDSTHAFGIFAEGFTAPPCTFNIVTDEMNILEMMVKSKLSNDLKSAEKTMRAEQVEVDGRVINNIFYKLTKGEVIKVGTMFKVKIITEGK